MWNSFSENLGDHKLSHHTKLPKDESDWLFSAPDTSVKVSHGLLDSPPSLSSTTFICLIWGMYMFDPFCFSASILSFYQHPDFHLETYFLHTVYSLKLSYPPARDSWLLLLAPLIIQIQPSMWLKLNQILLRFWPLDQWLQGQKKWSEFM